MRRLFKQFNEVLTKDIFKQKIIEAVNYKPKLEYLKSKFNHPNFDEIYIGDKTTAKTLKSDLPVLAVRYA